LSDCSSSREVISSSFVDWNSSFADMASWLMAFCGARGEALWAPVGDQCTRYVEALRSCDPPMAWRRFSLEKLRLARSAVYGFGGRVLGTSRQAPFRSLCSNIRPWPHGSAVTPRTCSSRWSAVHLTATSCLDSGRFVNDLGPAGNRHIGTSALIGTQISDILDEA
jgi:hypothetical protein